MAGDRKESGTDLGGRKGGLIQKARAITLSASSFASADHQVDAALLIGLIQRSTTVERVFVRATHWAGG